MVSAVLVAAVLSEVRAKRGLGADYLLDRLVQWLEHGRWHNLVLCLDQVDFLDEPDRTLQDYTGSARTPGDRSAW
ncbi:MAG: hypothetical protein V5A27_05960 [Halapricum sp.]